MRVIFLSILFFSFLSCKKTEQKAIAYPVSIPFTIVAKGDNFNTININQTGLGYTITNQNQWTIVLKKLDSLVLPLNPDVKVRNIDFQNNQLLVVIDSARFNGGWSIDILNVKEYQNNIEVAVDNIEKGNDATEVIQPYQIVKIPIQTKPIIFK